MTVILFGRIIYCVHIIDRAAPKVVALEWRLNALTMMMTMPLDCFCCFCDVDKLARPRLEPMMLRRAGQCDVCRIFSCAVAIDPFTHDPFWCDGNYYHDDEWSLIGLFGWNHRSANLSPTPLNMPFEKCHLQWAIESAKWQCDQHHQSRSKK